MESQACGIVIAGTGSGCGKTTVVCAVEKALVDRNLRVGAFKCGPDYIDTMFHAGITGSDCTNLDSFFFSENTLRWLLVKNASGKDISLVEGVMGYYDGRGLTTTDGSTWQIASITGLPAVLVVNAKGSALSVLAVIRGFLTFRPNSRIRGVILNGCTAMTYSVLREEILREFQGMVRPLGFLPQLPECALESRHLGLVTAQEVEDLHRKLSILAQQAEKTIDLDGIIELARSADPVSCDPVPIPRFEQKVRIAVARDKAFCFYYGENLKMLEEMGAELIPFSPLKDALPESIHGLYLGGGYPELYTQELSQNEHLRIQLRRALQNGLPCIAECGGFMYLCDTISGEPMAGLLPGDSRDTGKLVRFGYVTLSARKDNMLCRAGQTIRAHEFHHYDSTDPGSDFTAMKTPARSWSCVHASDTLYAGYPHFHFYSEPSFAEAFYRACVKEKNRT